MLVEAVPAAPLRELSLSSQSLIKSVGGSQPWRGHVECGRLTAMMLLQACWVTSGANCHLPKAPMWAGWKLKAPANIRNILFNCFSSVHSLVPFLHDLGFVDVFASCPVELMDIFYCFMFCFVVNSGNTFFYGAIFQGDFCYFLPVYRADGNLVLTLAIDSCWNGCCPL